MKSEVEHRQLDAKKKVRREVQRILTKYYDRASDYGQALISRQFEDNENTDPEEAADVALAAIAERYGLKAGSVTPALPAAPDEL